MIYIKTNLLRLTCVIIAMSVGSCALEETMKFDKLEYLISELPEAPHTLTIEADGRARYESHSNATTPDHPEIGTYQTTLPTSEIQSLDKLLGDPPFKSLPDHWGKVRSGERSRRIRITAGSEKSEKFVCSRLSVEPAMRRVIDALDKVVANVKSHPYQTLQIKLTQVNVSPDKVLTTVLSLSNTGIEPIYCRSPLNMIEGTDCQLSFQAWPDKPRSDLRPEDLTTANPTNVEDLHSVGGPSDAPQFIEVGPGATVSFRVRSALGLRTSGPHVIRILYANSSRQVSDHQLLVGEIFSETVKVIVP
jgi:hypothetical protein